MPVQIDRHMPMSCWDCPFHICMFKISLCMALQKEVTGECPTTQRYAECPLKEVKE